VTKRTRTQHPGSKAGIPQCTVEGCQRPYDALGYCNAHYQRFKRTGSAGQPQVRFPGFSRLYSRMILNPSGCVLWTGPLNDKGYGHTSVARKHIYVHRFMYEQFAGPIPPGLVIDHLCRVRNCCNVAHMEVVTNRENVLRGNGITARNAVKTECDYGHPFDEANTCVTPKGRICRACRNRPKQADGG
jgi:HNH endonuclease